MDSKDILGYASIVAVVVGGIFSLLTVKIVIGVAIVYLCWNHLAGVYSLPTVSLLSSLCIYLLALALNKSSDGSGYQHNKQQNN